MLFGALFIKPTSRGQRSHPKHTSKTSPLGDWWKEGSSVDYNTASLLRRPNIPSLGIQVYYRPTHEIETTLILMVSRATYDSYGYSKLQSWNDGCRVVFRLDVA